MKAAIRQWGRFALSYLGHPYIAKQVLASMVYYHAQFIRPEPAQLQEMVGLIARFVARPAHDGAGVEDPRAYIQHPQHAASSLQPLDGGVAAVDLLTQVDVLQAKIVARMHHPAATRGSCSCRLPSACGAPLPPHTPRHCAVLLSGFR